MREVPGGFVMLCSHSHLLLHAIKWYIGLLWYFPSVTCWKHGRACPFSLWRDLGVYTEAVHEIDTWEFHKRPSASRNYMGVAQTFPLYALQILTIRMERHGSSLSSSRLRGYRQITKTNGIQAFLKYSSAKEMPSSKVETLLKKAARQQERKPSETKDIVIRMSLGHMN